MGFISNYPNLNQFLSFYMFTPLPPLDHNPYPLLSLLTMHLLLPSFQPPSLFYWSLLFPLSFTIHHPVSAPPPSSHHPFFQPMTVTLSLVGWFYELVQSSNILSPHYINTQSSNLASFLFLSARVWDWKVSQNVASLLQYYAVSRPKITTT